MKDITQNPSTQRTGTIDTFALIDIVNDKRKESGESEIRRNDFMARIADELEGEYYETFVVQNLNKTESIGYSITLRQAMLVSMRESKAVRRGVVSYLEQLEDTEKGIALPDFNDPVASARAWADAKESEQKALEKIEEQAPKVAFVENLVERKTLMTATQVGQKHKISAIKLNRMLDDIGGIYSKSVKRSRTFCQSWIDGGLGEMKQTELGHSQALFTPAGEVEIARLLTSEGLV